MMNTDHIKKKLLMKKKPKGPLKKGDLVGSGSTLLNLAASGKSYGAFKKGSYNLFVGDSNSGKTWVSTAVLAEAAINPEFDGYRLIKDDAENGSHMDLRKYFGKLADRIEAPGKDEDGPVFSSTVEEFYYHLDDANARKEPFIYVLDSMDVLTTADEQDKFEESKDAHSSGKDVKGSYGTAKAKLNSGNLRVVVQGLRKTKSILVIITQTRDVLGFASMFKEKTRGGGHALKFYAHTEMWMARKSTIKSGKIRGKERQVGIESIIKIKKNRDNGREREVIIPIYHTFGIDDVGSCVDYLLEEGHWKKNGGQVVAPEFGFNGFREALCKKIDAEGKKPKLRTIVAKVWNEIEKACRIERTNPYS